MTVDELKAVVKSTGWTLVQRKYWHNHFYYAAKRFHGRRVCRYLVAESKLSEMTASDIVSKLQETSRLVNGFCPILDK